MIRARAEKAAKKNLLAAIASAETSGEETGKGEMMTGADKEAATMEEKTMAAAAKEERINPGKKEKRENAAMTGIQKEIPIEETDRRSPGKKERTGSQNHGRKEKAEKAGIQKEIPIEEAGRRKIGRAHV